jgi:hypothetical protein
METLVGIQILVQDTSLTHTHVERRWHKLNFQRHILNEGKMIHSVSDYAGIERGSWKGITRR